MENKILYQTLADRNNPQEIVLHGPYKCSIKKSPWFGEGYYFWDSFINLAHWWGRIGYNGLYVIGKIVYPYDSARFFDLTGANISNIKDLEECYAETYRNMRVQPTLPQLLEIMKKNTDLTARYIGIRGKGNHKTDIPENNIRFKNDKPYFFEMYPPIQICFFSNKSFKNIPFEIVYPPEYTKYEEMYI